MRTLLFGILVAVAAVGPVGPAAAQAGDERYAPLDQPGPPLQDPPEVLDRALRCPADLGPGDHGVLLVHGTALDAAVNFSWSYEPALTAAGYAVCLVDLVDNGMGDNQRSAERVVHAVRTMHAATGRPIGIVGYSQGGQVARWALRFWPDLRPMVDDLVTLSAPNNGALFADVLCAAPCAAAAWQQRMLGSAYIAALNSRATTFPGVDITSVYTRVDEIATPNVAAQSSYLPGAVNVATQDVCPLNVSEHLLLGTVDAVGYALVVDALVHDGPADPSRLSPTVCTQLFLPGVDPLEVPGRLVDLAGVIAQSLLAAPLLPAEPPLACYVTTSCETAEPPDRDAAAIDAADGPAPSPPAPGGGSASAAPPPTTTGPTGVEPEAEAEPTVAAAGGGRSRQGGATLPATGAEVPAVAAALVAGVALGLRALAGRAAR